MVNDPKEPGMIFGREPVLVLEVVRMVIVAAAVFGLPLTDVQQGTLILLASAVISVFARRRVEPYESDAKPGR